jgi:hypothetical protein
LDRLLEADPSIGQTRFHWLRSAPDAPSASNLVGLTERIAYMRAGISAPILAFVTGRAYNEIPFRTVTHAAIQPLVKHLLIVFYRQLKLFNTYNILRHYEGLFKGRRTLATRYCD